MHEFSCWATVGDTYIVLLKLLGIIGNKYGVDSGTRECMVRMFHYCDQQEHWKAVKELYSMYPFCIGIDLIPSDLPPDKLEPPAIFTTFDNKDDELYTKFVSFPDLRFANISKFKLPPKYVSVMVKAGRKEQNRELSSKVLKEIYDRAAAPIVLLGMDKRNIEICETLRKVIYLTNQTTFLEACEIIKHSAWHFAPPGASCLVAMSHKVYTTVLCMTDQERRSIEIRTAPEWKPYQFIFDKEIQWGK
jgi:hypothetical protein